MVLFLSQVLNVQVPFLFKLAVDWLTTATGNANTLASFSAANSYMLAFFVSPAAVLIGYGIARTGASAFNGTFYAYTFEACQFKLFSNVIEVLTGFLFHTTYTIYFGILLLYVLNTVILFTCTRRTTNCCIFQGSSADNSFLITEGSFFFPSFVSVAISLTFVTHLRYSN